MRATIEKYLPDFDQIKKIKEKLRACKDEWLEEDEKGRKVLGHNTVRQIIENAVDGATYWDFDIDHQWREEVYKYDKKTGTWSFDGYVYHVRGSLFIAGIGQRTQYGCKVAIGGKDNQNSAYKAAASDCFKKCASLFGIGEEIYSKIKIDTDDEYTQLQADPNYMMIPQQQSWDQQPGYGPFMQQQSYQGQLAYGYPQGNGWGQPIYDQQPVYQQPQQQIYWAGQANPVASNVVQFPQQQASQQQANWVEDINKQANGTFTMTDDQFPFNPYNEGTPEHDQWNRAHLPQQQESASQQANNYVAQPTAQAEPASFTAQPQEFGAPINVQAPTTVQQEQSQPQPSAIPAEWDQNELMKVHQHRARLGIQTDEQMNHYIRDFLKSDTATMKDLTPDKLKSFNEYLSKIAV